MIIHNPILTGSLTLNNVNLSTGNLVTTGSNTFVGNQTISGSTFITGSISIGTTSSSDLVTIGSSNTRGAVSIWGSTTAAPVLQLSNTNASGSSWNVYAGYGSDPKQFIIYDATNSQPRLAISASGNVGIGTTSPSDILDVQKNHLD